MSETEKIEIKSRKDAEAVAQVVVDELQNLKTQIMRESEDLKNYIEFTKNLLANNFDATVKVYYYNYMEQANIIIYKDKTKIAELSIPKETPIAKLNEETLKQKQILFNQVLREILDIIVKMDELNVYNRLDNIEYKLERVLNYLEDP